jgi:3-methyl-2-oxobutanoate hydroxymethyltransferase
MKHVTVTSLRRMKEHGDPITMVTAYDATFAALFERAGIDVLLVGDSLGMVVQGHMTTLPVTMEDMVYHTRAVVRRTERVHVVADLPFMSYQASPSEGVSNAGRLLKEGGAHAVKLEGGVEVAATVEAMVRAGIPVMGHLGLTPQSIHAMGGYRVQGKTASAAHRILEDARALERAGVYALVLEGVPSELAERVTGALSVPTIGIGAGSACDGQVLVGYDMLGLNDGHRPKFVRAYAELAQSVVAATEAYCEDVKARRFPGPEHGYAASEQLFGPRSVDQEEEEDGPEPEPFSSSSS